MYEICKEEEENKMAQEEGRRRTVMFFIFEGNSVRKLFSRKRRLMLLRATMWSYTVSSR